MVSCPSCGAEVPDGFAFCGRCGAALASGAGLEERRVVTVLFCDLVGFTAQADQADPEDVRALLRPTMPGCAGRSSGSGGPWTSSSATA